MWMDGSMVMVNLNCTNPMGNIIRTLIESGATLGVSSRGSGEVNPSGEVSNFEIVTVDIVAQPSAEVPSKAIYEGLMNMRGGYPNLATSTKCTTRQGRSKVLVRTNR